MKYLCLVYGEEAPIREQRDRHCMDYVEKLMSGPSAAASVARAGSGRPVGADAAARVAPRRAARTDATGELVLLDAQDRSLWNAELIAEGCLLVETALTSRRFGPYCLQAAIAAVHAEAARSH